MASLRKMLNSISKLRIDDEWEDNPERKRNHIELYYHNLYYDPFPFRPEIKGVCFDCIEEDDQRWLERPFLEEKVLCALNLMEDEKASSPDGFPIKCLKVCWDVVGKEALDILVAFHDNDQWCRSLSATFITLIPKKTSASEVKDYISLVGCLYKLFSKILAQHLRIVLPKIISPS